MIDALGFAGSGLIVLSLTMKSMIRLRLVGLVGATVFVLYGLSLGAWPVVFTNTVALSIHVFHLRRLIIGGGQLDKQPSSGPRSNRAGASLGAGTPAER